MSRAWIRGLPTSPIMSAMGPGGWHAVRVRGELQALGGCSRVWVHGLPRSPIMSAYTGQAGVTRSRSVVSRDLRSLTIGIERVSRTWIRGLPWPPTMSAMGPGGCRAVRVRGGASAISGACHAVRVHGLLRSDHGAGGRHAARLRDLHGLRL